MPFFWNQWRKYFPIIQLYIIQSFPFFENTSCWPFTSERLTDAKFFSECCQINFDKSHKVSTHQLLHFLSNLKCLKRGRERERAESLSRDSRNRVKSSLVKSRWSWTNQSNISICFISSNSFNNKLITY